jgi:hypothetical protein
VGVDEGERHRAPEAAAVRGERGVLGVEAQDDIPEQRVREEPDSPMRSTPLAGARAATGRRGVRRETWVGRGWPRM